MLPGLGPLKMITFENAVFDVSFKICLFSMRAMFRSLHIRFFFILNNYINFRSCDITVSIYSQDSVFDYIW